MKIIFMGTPDIARKALSALYEQNYEIAAVFTGEDKPRGRGMKLSPSPVKELALEHGTMVCHPENLTVDLIGNLNPDIIAVVAFGKILRHNILNIPPLGCINIHGSVLPEFRGAAPIQYAILNGKKETGVTSMYMAEKMDAGDIIFTRNTPISDDETSADLFIRLGDIGAKLLVDTIEAVKAGNAPRIPQNDSLATYAPMLTKEMSPIDFSASAYEIKCKVRALIPWPVATMELYGRIVKVYSVEISDKKTGLQPGTVIKDEHKSNLEIACSDGTIIIGQIQPPNGKVMNAAEYLRGIK